MEKIIVYTHSDCLAKDNGPNHPERKERLETVIESVKELVSLENSSIGLRIEIKKGGCSGMTYDVVHAKSFNEQDEVIKKDGVTFVIDPSAILFIIGSTIDWKEDKFKRGFSFENPNETARCGRGESFSI